MDYPRLLICKDLVRSLNQALEELERLAGSVGDETPDVLLHGGFVMAFALFESSQSDSLAYYLRHFPEKIGDMEFSAKLDSLPTTRMELIDRAVEKYVWRLNYKSIDEIQTIYESHLSLDYRSEMTSELEIIQEARATRNALLHNGLKSNDAYLHTSGPGQRVETIGEPLELSVEYVAMLITSILNVVSTIVDQINQKYSNYSLIRANEALWNFLFNSPVAVFEDYWVLDRENDTIPAMSDVTGHRLSGTEKLVLGIWRSHFNGDSELMKGFNMRLFDKVKRKKVQYLLSIADRFSFY